MITDAIIKTKKITKDREVVQIYSPKFPNAAPVLTLSSAYKNKPVKLITEWDDITIKTPVTINGGVINDNLVGKAILCRGMVVSCSGDKTLYVVTVRQMLQ